MGGHLSRLLSSLHMTTREFSDPFVPITHEQENALRVGSQRDRNQLHANCFCYSRGDTPAICRNARAKCEGPVQPRSKAIVAVVSDDVRARLYLPSVADNNAGPSNYTWFEPKAA